MNLHLIPDDKFVSRLIERIEALGLLSNNKFVVKKAAPFHYLRQAWLQGAEPNTYDFQKLTGDLSQYDKVFLHFMDEPSIQWIVDNNLKNIYWHPWGADIYETRYGGFQLNDKLTSEVLGATLRNKINRSIAGTIQKIKHRSRYRNAYSRIGYICNWIYDEYLYAVKHLPGLSCEHRFFVYDVDIPFTKLAKQLPPATRPVAKSLRVQLGQSTTPAGNHATALQALRKVNRISEVVIPASYGSAVYTSKLEQWVSRQNFPFAVTFFKEYKPFDQYFAMMDTFDVMLLNSIRPAGMGNFWLGVMLGKAVLLRRESLACRLLKDLGLTFYYVDDWCDSVRFPSQEEISKNRQVCLEFFSDEKIRDADVALFG